MSTAERRSLTLAALMFASACVSTGATRQQNDALAVRFAQADAKHAHTLAPDLYARAERAWQDAKNAHGDAAARADHEVRARLLLEAAAAEADRIELERAASAAEARFTRAVEERAQLERDRIELEAAAQREEAARTTHTDAERVFGGALPASTASHGLDATARAAKRAKDAELVRDRAMLMLAAATALGLAEEDRAELAQAITRAEQARGNALLEAAHAVLAKAERALGKARKARGGPTPAQTAELLAAAAERGLAAQASARGVAMSLATIFGDNSAQPTAHGRDQLEQIAALVRAHPHGTIAIEELAGKSTSTAAHQLALARAHRVESLLQTATESSRLQLTEAPLDERGAERAQLLFTAYVSSSDPGAAAQPVALTAAAAPALESRARLR